MFIRYLDVYIRISIYKYIYMYVRVYMQLEIEQSDLKNIKFMLHDRSPGKDMSTIASHGNT